MQGQDACGEARGRLNAKQVVEPGRALRILGPSMLRYLIRRLLLTIPVLLGVATLVFSLIHLVPGDPAQAMLGESASPEDVAELRHSLGLDRPLLGAVRVVPRRRRCAAISAPRSATARR